MPASLTVLRAFLASPSDLARERTIALEVQNRVNGVALNHGMLVHLMMWEQVLPSAGRPQDLINRMVDECDLFVGLLYEKWGTRTGRYSSGFAEEFDRALKRRDRDGTPDIALFFKQPRPASASDPDHDLKRVVAFKRRMSQSVLYNEVRSVEDWRWALTRLLTEVVTAASFADLADALEDERLSVRILRLVGDLGVAPSSAHGSEEMKQILAAGINRLGEREKIVLTLYYYEGLTMAQVAEVLGVAEERVREIHTKAVLQLRSRLSAPKSVPSRRSTRSSRRTKTSPQRAP